MSDHAEKDARRRRAAYLHGATLGTYQAHALAGTPAALVVLLATPHWWLALMFGVGATLGWVGWWRQYGLRWRPWNTRPIPPVERDALRYQLRWWRPGGFRWPWLARRTGGRWGLGRWTQAEVDRINARAAEWQAHTCPPYERTNDA